MQDVNAPASVVLGCLESFEDYPDMIPVVRQARIKSRLWETASKLTAMSKYRISRFWLSVSVVHHVDRDDGLVRFDLDPSCTGTGLVLREASGFWMVQPSPCGNPNRCRVWLCTGLRASTLLPHWLIDYAAERALRRATTWLRPHVETVWARQAEETHALEGQREKMEQVRSWQSPLLGYAAAV